MQILRQSTAVDVLIGPFVDLADGYTAETSETPSVKLSKNGQTMAAKNDATTPAHDADGYYNCELDATDTNTVGTLTLAVAASANALPVRHEFQVVEESVYDRMFATSAVGPVTVAEVNAQCDAAISDASLATAASISSLNDLSAAEVNAEVDQAIIDASLATASSIASLNDLSAAEVNAECDTAIADAALATAAALATTDGVVDDIRTDMVRKGTQYRYTNSDLDTKDVTIGDVP